MPQLLFNQPIESDITNRLDLETKDYYSKKLTQGKWLQRALEQRKETMINVMRVITEKQKDYFLYGKNQLKPLTLKNIAEILDIHESTVSRTVKDKYVQTPHGLVSMKSFFSNKLDEEKGEISTASVKIRLKELIDAEDKKKPLSDQKIANSLKTSYGITISRRTVTKYREQLNIPTSGIRKQY
jgi:RNA polymerase sigma-54 factor